MPHDAETLDAYSITRSILIDEDVATPLVKKYQSRIAAHVRQYRNNKIRAMSFGSGVDWIDLVQEGLIALIIADARFNKEYNDGRPWPTGADTAPFEPYLDQCLRNRYATLRRSNADRNLRLVEGTVVIDPETGFEVDLIEEAEDTAAILSEDTDSVLSVVEFAEKMLKPLERKIVEFIKSKEYDTTDEEIALALGLSESKVWRLRHRIMRLACLYATADMPEWKYPLRHMEKASRMLEAAEQQKREGGK